MFVKYLLIIIVLLIIFTDFPKNIIKKIKECFPKNTNKKNKESFSEPVLVDDKMIVNINGYKLNDIN